MGTLTRHWCLEVMVTLFWSLNNASAVLYGFVGRLCILGPPHADDSPDVKFSTYSFRSPFRSWFVCFDALFAHHYFLLYSVACSMHPFETVSPCLCSLRLNTGLVIRGASSKFSEQTQVCPF